MPKVVDRSLLRRQIRAAAIQVFSQRGVKGTGMTHVADALGIGRSTLYYYYPNKRALIADITRNLLSSEVELFRAAATAAGSPGERLNTLIVALSDSLDDWRTVAAFVHDVRAVSQRQFRTFYAKIRASLATLIGEGQQQRAFDASLAPEFAASLVIAVIDGALLQFTLDPSSIPRGPERASLFVRAVERILSP